MKEFNTTALCIPSKHYMVDLAERVSEIKKLVDEGKYFCINRARQYGKTTTLNALAQALKTEYTVFNTSFEGIGDAGFASEAVFANEFCRLIRREFRGEGGIPDEIKKEIDELAALPESSRTLGALFDAIYDWCEMSEKEIVLIIDEIDSATNNQVFLDFLAQLRDGYIRRGAKGAAVFKSVVLAGVTDIRHLKSKIRDDAAAKQNSPWNIAADFNIDMSFSPRDIQGMLKAYESEHHSGMDVEQAAQLIYDYTDGYPFLVSRLCQLIDVEVSRYMDAREAWSRCGIDEAVKLILAENNTLFQSLNKNLNNFPKLKDAIHSILMEGERIAWNSDQDDIVTMQMYGFIKNENNSVKISNRIFETRFYNLFLSDEELKKSAFYKEGALVKNIFVEDGRLNMRLILERFIDTYTQVCGPLEERFKEKDGREQFLLFLRPIINGTGNYYIEAQTRDQTRTDVIVDYLGKQYIIELKIWRGERYNARGEAQIIEYLNYWKLECGYMLSFNFNKKKETGVKRVEIAGKLLYEGML